VGAILEAAEQVFADRGLHAAHMGEIAARAGVAVGTLYNHFEDREALLTGLIERRRQELLGKLDARLKQLARATVTERLRAVVLVLLEHVRGHRAFMHILLQGEVGRYQSTFPSAARLPVDTMRALLARLEPLVKQAIRAGLIRAELADLAPVLLLGLVRAIVVRDMIDGRRDIVDEADRLLGFFLRGAAP
jgi:AcrR family transcriptional regulator